MVGGWQWAVAQDRYDDDTEIINEVTGGNSDVLALGLSQSLGDVDIAGCIVTTQFGIIIFQKQSYEYDVFCLADRLDEAAKIFGGRCLRVMKFEPDEKQAPEPTPTWSTEEQVAVNTQQHEERDDRLAAIEQRLDREASARRVYARKLEAEKEAEQQRAFEALKAYEQATQNDQ